MPPMPLTAREEDYELPQLYMQQNPFMDSQDKYYAHKLNHKHHKAASRNRNANRAQFRTSRSMSRSKSNLDLKGVDFKAHETYRVNNKDMISALVEELQPKKRQYIIKGFPKNTAAMKKSRDVSSKRLPSTVTTYYTATGASVKDSHTMEKYRSSLTTKI